MRLLPCASMTLRGMERASQHHLHAPDASTGHFFSCSLRRSPPPVPLDAVFELDDCLQPHVHVQRVACGHDPDELILEAGLILVLLEELP